MSINTLTLPALGDGVTEVTLSRWLKQPGQTIALNEPVCEVETDKISVEVTANTEGRLGKLRAVEGAKVRVGEVLAEILAGDGGPETADDGRLSPVTGRPSPVPGQPGAHGGNTRVSPVVSRMIAEHNLDLNAIMGSGEGGRVTRQDVLAALAGIRSPDSADSDSLVPLSPMRARIAEHTLRSVQTSPHVTTVFEFDFARVGAHRDAAKAGVARDGIKLTHLAYLVCATAQALRKHPIANSQWASEGIVLLRDINIGIAVAVPPDGLLVPVIHHADELSLGGVARKIQDLANRARNKQLEPRELQGGTFSISNHGAGGSLAGTPIINQPQAGILGFGAIEKRVAVIDDMIAIRPRAFVSLSFDHRIMDGAQADAFVMEIKRAIENWV